MGFEEALLAGLARDGGLYVPEVWPRLAPDEIAAFAGRPFAEVAAAVLELFAGDAIPCEELLALARDAYARFGHPAVTPLVQIDRNLWVLELFHGPTLAFKDVAMQLVARLMDRVLAARGQRVTVVGATSGDTGGAAIEAFRGSQRVDAVVLFPNGRVSDVQRRMMTTATEANVHAVAIEGTFDDCQALVKGMFNDLAFRDRVGLAGVNSINWARVAAQITYYFVAAAALGAPHRPVSFAVPDRQLRRHLRRLCGQAHGAADRAAGDRAPTTTTSCAAPTRRGTYEVRGVMPTTSPSMDIQVSSNFERYLFEASGRDAAWVRGRMGALAQSGRFELSRDGARAPARRLRRGHRHHGRGGRLHPAREGRQRLPARPAHRLRRDRGGEGAGQGGDTPPARRRSCSPPPAPPSSPTPSRPSPGSGRRCRRGSPPS